MRTPLLFFLRFCLGMVLAWLLGFGLIRLSGERWHRLGGRDPVAPLHAFQHTPGPIDLVFFGTSSTRNAVVPELLEEQLGAALHRSVTVWNLAIPNATPEIGGILVDDFFQPDKPRCLVLEAAPFLWDGDRGDDADFSVYWRWFSSPTSLFAEGRPLRRQDLIPFLRNLNRDWEDLWSACPIVRVEALRADRSGLPPQGGLYFHDKLDLTPASTPVDRATPTREMRRVSHYSTPQVWEHELEHLLDRCEALGIEVILMHQPMYPKLLPMFEAGSYQAFLSWMQEVARRHELPFLQLQDEIPLGVEDYRDFIHYSPQGARHFTEALVPYLAPLLSPPTD